MLKGVNNVRLVPLTKGAFAKVDAEDFELAMRYRWYLNDKPNGMRYAITFVKINGVKKHLKLHRLVLGAPEGVQVDHRNRDGLDCTRGNLRLASHRQNICNQKKKRGGSSKYKGVYWSKREEKWVTEIRCDGKKRHIGTFSSEEDAARAYDQCAKELNGDFVVLNFPESISCQGGLSRMEDDDGQS